jgi:hypothetical protein
MEPGRPRDDDDGASDRGHAEERDEGDRDDAPARPPARRVAEGICVHAGRRIAAASDPLVGQEAGDDDSIERAEIERQVRRA